MCKLLITRWTWPGSAAELTWLCTKASWNLLWNLLNLTSLCTKPPRPSLEPSPKPCCFRFIFWQATHEPQLSTQLAAALAQRCSLVEDGDRRSGAKTQLTSWLDGLGVDHANRAIHQAYGIPVQDRGVGFDAYGWRDTSGHMCIFIYVCMCVRVLIIGLFHTCTFHHIR